MSFDLEVLASGYGLIEGPRVDAEDNLYFSDVPNGGVYRRDPSGEISVVIPKRRGVGGIALHTNGGLVVSGRNICHVVGGETRIVFDNGAPGFNDLFTDAAGRVVCGALRSDPFAEGSGRTPGEAYRIGLDGEVEEMYGGVLLTNGIGFSPDGSNIYHSDTGSNHVICHDVDGDRYLNRRPLGQRRDFFPDGLAVDEGGTIWVADYQSGCVRGLDPVGNEVERIEVPSNAVTSVCFGGADRRDLYIVTADNTDNPERAGTIFRTRAEVAGVAVALARI